MNSRTLVFGLAVVSGLVFASGVFGQSTNVTFPAPSPACTLKQRVGLTDIQIEYSRPSAKGRQIFGGLLPYGEVWRAGANAATKITFSTPVKLNGTEVPAGTFALFAIPGQDEWTIIIGKGPQQWGAYSYSPTNDIVRVPARPRTLTAPIETFVIEFNNIHDQSATLNLAWENTLVPIKLEVDVAATLVPQIDAAIAAVGGKSANLYYSSALFYYENGLDLNKALPWANEAVKLNTNAPYMMLLNARIQAKLGHKNEAIAAAKKTSELGVKAEGPKSGFVKMSADLITSLQ